MIRQDARLTGIAPPPQLPRPAAAAATSGRSRARPSWYMRIIHLRFFRLRATSLSSRRTCQRGELAGGKVAVTLAGRSSSNQRRRKARMSRRFQED